MFDSRSRPPPVAELTSGQFGRFGCDTPPSLLQSSMSAMTEIEQQPDFILLTGDSAAHHLVDPTHLSSMAAVSSALQNAFPNTPVLPLIGNNDLPADYDVTCNDPYLQQLASVWKAWIPPSQLETFGAMGAYNASVVPGLRLLLLNTVIYSPSDNYTAPAADPCGQFAWLGEQLEFARAAGDKVYLAGHIIPGMDAFRGVTMWGSPYTLNFYSIISEYLDVISGMFFGHIHSDEFRLLWENATQTTPLASLLIAPSITPVYSNNPGIRLVTYAPDTFVPDNYFQFYLDLFAANQNGTANWQLEYTFQEAYSASQVDVVALQQLYERLLSNHSLFEAYYARHSVQFNTQKFQILCGMISQTLQDYAGCLARNAPA